MDPKTITGESPSPVDDSQSDFFITDEHRASFFAEECHEEMDVSKRPRGFPGPSVHINRVRFLYLISLPVRGGINVRQFQIEL